MPNRKNFIKLSSAAAAGVIFAPSHMLAQEENLKNWAGNITYGTRQLYTPATIGETQKLVSRLSKVKALGTRHCFNSIADSKDNLLSLKQMDEQIYALDTKAMKVTVSGAMKYGYLAPYLQSKGYALHNLASLPHISVAGACATATHGSGVKNGNLSTAVSAMEIIKSNGEVVSLSREKDGDRFYGAVVNLGALGIVSKITLDIQPSFNVRQDVYQNLPLARLQKHFDEIVSAGYSVSLFTDWQTTNINEVWIKTKIEEGRDYHFAGDFFGAAAATRNLHPIADLSAENCTEQLGVPGPWYERLPHFKMGFTPSSGKELQSEYFVPRAHAVEAIMKIQRLGKQIGRHLFITEIRTIDADECWMSPCYRQPSVTIHFTWKQDIPEVSQLLPVIERELAPFHAKPHWGKIFHMSYSRLSSLYPRMEDFRQLAASFDPEGKFRNDFLNRNVFA